LIPWKFKGISSSYSEELRIKTLTVMFTDHIPADATVRNLPDFHDTIFRPTSYNVVIMWTPGNIQYRPFVTTYQRMVCSNSSYLDKVITAIRTEVISIRTDLKVPTYLFILLAKSKRCQKQSVEY
jgi:hypothetical protein